MVRVGRPREDGDDSDAVAWCPYCKGPKYVDEPRRGACVECKPVLARIQEIHATDEVGVGPAEPSPRQSYRVRCVRYWGLAILRGLWPARASRGRAV